MLNATVPLVTVEVIFTLTLKLGKVPVEERLLTVKFIRPKLYPGDTLYTVLSAVILKLFDAGKDKMPPTIAVKSATIARENISRKTNL